MSLYIICILVSSTVAFRENVYEYEVFKPTEEKFAWRNCNTTVVPAVFTSFLMTPDPIKGGDNIYVSFDLDVTKAIGTTKELEANLELTLTTKGTLIDLCRYDPLTEYCKTSNFCKLIKNNFHYCPAMITKLGNQCRCPVKENTYSVKNAVFPFPKVPIEGLFHAKLNFSESESPVGCVEFDICIGVC